MIARHRRPMKVLLLAWLSLICHGASTGGKGCPPEGILEPCACAEEDETGWGGARGPQLVLRCEGLRGTVQLENALAVAGGGRRIRTLDLDSLYADFLPASIFESVELESLRLNRSALSRLFDGESSQGLSEIEELTLEEVRFAEGFQFDSLTELHSLRSLFLRGVWVPRVGASFRAHCAPGLRFLGLGRSGTSVLEPGALARLEGLLYLAVTETLVAEIARDVLPDLLPDLKVLFLSKNCLSSLPTNMFAGMPSLETVALGGNRLTFLDIKTFAPVWSHLKHLIADDNPLICDCRIRWLLNMSVTEEERQKVLATCTRPKSLQLEDLRDLRPSDIEDSCT